MNPRGADPQGALVVIVDDDGKVREALAELMATVGLETACFGSAREFMDSPAIERPGCMILDVRLPGVSGLEFQHHLAASGNSKPVVFLTGHGDIPMSVQAMKAGAVDFLTKPVRDQTLIDAVMLGIERDIAQRAAAETAQVHIDHYNELTPRERQVLREVARGRVNKQIGYDLGISEITVKLHRGNLMRKMQAASVGDIIRAWEALPVSLREKEPT